MIMDEIAEAAFGPLQHRGHWGYRDCRKAAYHLTARGPLLDFYCHQVSVEQEERDGKTMVLIKRRAHGGSATATAIVVQFTFVIRWLSTNRSTWQD
jgi:hypothetical protein